MKTVIWLCGGHRSGSNFIGCFLKACGAETQARVKPQPSQWNREYSDDPWVLHYLSRVLGPSEIGLPNPEPPESPDAAVVAEFQQYVRGRFDACTDDKPYLLKINVGGASYRLLLPLFPAETTHILVSTRRNAVSQWSSLAARTKADPAVCAEYLSRVDKQLVAMEADFEARNWLVVRVLFDEVIANPAAILPPVAAKCGLDVPDGAIAAFDVSQVRF